VSTDDPRYLRSREAILRAARGLLLQHGPTAVTHQQVAEKAGVGRATVYRHWPRADQLLADAMATVPMPFFDTPVSPLRAWLVTELTTIARQLENDDVLAVSTTLAHAALWDTAMDARRADFASALATRLTTAVEEAQRLGELEPQVPIDSAAAVLVGPIYYRATIERSTTSRATIDSLVDALGTWNSG
jgi:AcrR family transcriptional regulator